MIQPSRNAFGYYSQIYEHVDQDFINDCNQSMDSLLVFAGLFSATITALATETSKLLQSSNDDRMEQLLEGIFLQLAHPSSSTGLPTPKRTSPIAIAINVLFFLSLVVSLVSALSAMLVKQWARQYGAGLNAITSQRVRARTRQERWNGIFSWHLPQIIAGIPMMLHMALLLFFIGLLLWLYTMSLYVFICIATIVGLSLFFYLAVAAIPAFNDEAPFDWPVTEIFRPIARRYPPAVRRPHVSDIEKASNAKESPFPSSLRLVPILEDELIAESSSPSEDKRDLDLIFDLVKQADDDDIYEKCISQLRKLVIAGVVADVEPTVWMNTLPQIIGLGETCMAINVNTKKKILRSSHEYVERAIIITRTLEWIHQLLISHPSSPQYLIHFNQEVRENLFDLVQSVRDYGIQTDKVDVAILATVVLAHSYGTQIIDRDHIQGNINIMKKLVEISPYYSKTRNTEGGEGSDVWYAERSLRFENLVTDYFTSLIPLFNHYNPDLGSTTLKVDKLHKILRTNARNIFVASWSETITYTLLVETFSKQWVRPGLSSWSYDFISAVLEWLGYTADEDVSGKRIVTVTRSGK